MKTRNVFKFILNCRPYGGWAPLYKQFIPFMGIQNTIFLMALIDRYNYLQRKKFDAKNGVLKYKAGDIEKIWCLSSYQQRKSREVLGKCGLITELGKTSGYRNEIKIHMGRCICLIKLIGKWSKEKEILSDIFKSIQTDETYRQKKLEELETMEKCLEHIVDSPVTPEKVCQLAK
jgi:hypothetical protein